MDQIPPEWKFILLLTEDEVIQLLYGNVRVILDWCRNEMCTHMCTCDI